MIALELIETKITLAYVRQVLLNFKTTVAPKIAKLALLLLAPNVMLGII